MHRDLGKNNLLRKRSQGRPTKYGDLGYETTANAILYGLITLALHPEIQDKVIVEIDAVYASAASDGRTKLSYTQDFEKLQYTYGFMVGSKPYVPPNVVFFPAV